jgi:hypothetical protein
VKEIVKRYGNWDASYQGNIAKLAVGVGRKVFVSPKWQIYTICAFVAFIDIYKSHYKGNGQYFDTKTQAYMLSH